MGFCPLGFFLMSSLFSIHDNHIIMSFQALPKFVLTIDGHIRIGMVHLHSELVQPDDQPILYRQSHDYGVPRWHLVEKVYVPSDYRGYYIKYIYDDGWHEDYNVSDKHIIEYY